MVVVLLSVPIYTVLKQNNPDISSKIAEGETITGKVAITIEDLFDEETSKESYFVATNTGESIGINPSEEQKEELSAGDMVTVSETMDEKLHIEAVDDGVFTQISSEETNSLGKHDIPVILINFTNSGSNTISKQTVDQKVVSQIEDYFNKVSYGKTILRMQVYGWYTIAPPPSDKTCYTDLDDDSWMQRAITAADNEIDFTNIKRFLIIVSETDQCYGGAASLSTEGGHYLTQEGKKPMGFSYGSMGIRLLQDPTFSDKEAIYEGTMRVGAHELLHTFGLRHANGLKCGPSRYLDPPPCTSNEYSDNFSMMGGTAWGLNIPHMLAIGWLEDSRVTTVTQSGIYEITPMEINDNKPKGIRIYRQHNPAGSAYEPQYLYVEYRQQIFPDIYNTVRFPWQTTDVYDGALLHLNVMDKRVRSIASLLVDVTPQDTLYNAALLPNVPFTDPLTGVKMVVTGKTSTSLLVQVTFPSSTITPTGTPTPTLTPTKSPTPTLTPTKSPIPTKSPNPTPTKAITPTAIITKTPTPSKPAVSSPTPGKTSCDPYPEGDSAGRLNIQDLVAVRREVAGIDKTNRGKCLTKSVLDKTSIADLLKLRRILVGLESDQN